MPVAGSLASAKLAKAGIGSYLSAVIIGVVLAVGFTWAMRTVGQLVGAHLKEQPMSTREWYARALYLGAMLWIVLGLFLGGFAAAVIRRLF